jgi:hypothetical protein
MSDISSRDNPRALIIGLQNCNCMKFGDPVKVAGENSVSKSEQKSQEL